MQLTDTYDGLRDSYGDVQTLKLLELDLPAFARMAISLLLMTVLVAVVSVFGLPNPNMVLITGLVVCCVLFGIPGGSVAAATMMAYTTYFFSTDHNFVTYTPENFMKVAVTMVGVCVVFVFVCRLKGVEDRALRDATALAVMLKEDNQLLQQASTIDALTGLRNRFALRRDYPQYVDAGKRLHVMMLDLDNFKEINDANGHARGDEALADFSTVLADVFGADHAYRYGGDEFLVIVSEWTDVLFDAACEQMRTRLDAVAQKREGDPVQYSGGYTSGVPQYNADLRLMIRQADNNLYQAKHQGKDQVSGGAFDRAAAEKLVVDGRAVRFGDRTKRG